MTNKGIPYDCTDALAMCVRLYSANRCPDELKDLLGAILIDIADMASRLIMQATADMALVRVCEDYDARMETVCIMLRKIREGAVNTDKPRGIVNYFVKISQNRLRNISRNRKNRERLRPTASLSDMLESDFATACDINGKIIHKQQGDDNVQI